MVTGLSVPLSCFVEYLSEVKEFDRQCPELKQAEWLMKNFSFDDQRACYEVLPQSAVGNRFVRKGEEE